MSLSFSLGMSHCLSVCLSLSHSVSLPVIILRRSFFFLFRLCSTASLPLRISMAGRIHITLLHACMCSQPSYYLSVSTHLSLCLCLFVCLCLCLCLCLSVSHNVTKFLFLFGSRSRYHLPVFSTVMLRLPWLYTVL